jgi:hypothetical protein
MPQNLPAGTVVTSLRDQLNNLKNNTSNAAQRVSEAWNIITGRPFNPGVPLQPTSNIVEQTQGPRQFQYPVNANLITKPRQEYPDLTPFDQLRNMATFYDVANIAIGVRIEEMQGLDWAVVAKDKKQQDAKEKECETVTEFWKYPDKLNEFSSWLAMLLHDHFVLDAMTLYKHPDKKGGLYCLEAVDGSTIKPLLDDRGRVLAYQQIIQGYPRSDYKRYGTSNPDFEPEEEFPTFGSDELIYRPRYPRSNTPYGTSSIERVILRINTAIRKQMFDLRYFTDGNIPDAWVQPTVDARLNPDQVRAFEEDFNALLEGNDAARRKIRFLPWRGDVREMRPFQYDTKLDDFMMRLTCAAIGVTPTEIGFTDTVNKASSEGQEDVTYRRSLIPLCKWLKVLFDRIIQNDLGHPDLEWKWIIGNGDDEAEQATTDVAYITAGVLSADEVRTMRFSDEVDGPSPASIEQKKAEEQQKQMAAQGMIPGQPGQQQQQPPAQAQAGPQAQQQQQQQPDNQEEDFTKMSNFDTDRAVLTLLKDVLASGGGYQLDQHGQVSKIPKAPKAPKAPKVKGSLGPKTPGFGKKPVGTRVYGQKNIQNTNNPNAPKPGHSPVRGSTANPNHTQTQYYTAPKQPKGGFTGDARKAPKSSIIPKTVSSSSTSSSGVRYGASAGANNDLLKALADGLRTFVQPEE